MEYLLIAVIGILLGIIINYFSDVLPHSPGLSAPTCAGCEHPFSVKDYLYNFRCSHCDARLPARNLLVILVSVGISFLMKLDPPALLGYWAALPVTALLGIIFVIDLEHHAILLKTTGAGFVLFLTYGIIFLGWKKSLLGALGGLAITLVFYILGILISKLVGAIRKKKLSEVAFGLGDVLAATVFGLLVGWPAIIGVIIIAIVSFALVSVITLIVLILTKKYTAFSNALPFAPFLILGIAVIFYL